MQESRAQNTQPQNTQLVDQLNFQICELETLMQKFHFSLNELRLAHPNSAGTLADAGFLKSDSPLREPLEFRPARISHC